VKLADLLATNGAMRGLLDEVRRIRKSGAAPAHQPQRLRNAGATDFGDLGDVVSW
jgi:hypothetical protein